MAENMSRLGRVDELGRLFVVTSGIPARGAFLAGVRLGPQGVAKYTSIDPRIRTVNGVPMNGDAVAFAVGGTIHHYLDGLPMTVDGRLVGQLNAVTSSSDTFVEKVRVGPLGGIYLVDVNPPVFKAWSSGFSTGFGL